MCRFYSTPMQNQTYSMNVSDMSEDEVDEAVSEALHGIIKAMDLWKEKKSFHQKVTDALFTILNAKISPFSMYLSNGTRRYVRS